MGNERQRFPSIIPRGPGGWAQSTAGAEEQTEIPGRPAGSGAVQRGARAAEAGTEVWPRATECELRLAGRR